MVEVRAVADYEACVGERLGLVAGEGEAEVIVELGRQAPTLPERDCDQVGEGVQFWDDDSTIYMSRGDIGVRVEGQHVRIGGPIDTMSSLDQFDDLLQFGVAIAMATPGRLMIHAAVIARDGDALVLVGTSGRGKSTLAASAFLGGWDLLGDDLAVVHPSQRLVRGVQRPPMIPPDIAELHGVEGAVEKSPRARVQLPASVLYPGSARLVGVVTVCHGDEGGIEPLPGADLNTLDAALPVPPFSSVIRRQLPAAAALVGLPTVMLSHARDLNVRVERAQASLDAAFEHCLADQ